MGMLMIHCQTIKMYWRGARCMSVCLGGYSGIVSHSDDRVESRLGNFSFSIKLRGSESILENRIRI